MIRAAQVKPQHRWSESPADTVVLDFDDRHRRRMAMTGTRGLAFLLDLEQAVALRGGDALVLDDGRLIEVVAAPEPLIEIKGRDPQHLVRLAWHLGNRHLPTQITPKALRIRRDHVITEMLKGLGARILEIEAPFDPEGGAYAGGGHAPAEDAVHQHPRTIMQHMAMIIMRMMTTIMMNIAAMSIIIITTTLMLMTINDPAPVDDRREMTDGEAAALYRLMTWLSPAFPVGGFSYSCGIEWAVEAGDIADAGTLRDWLAAMLEGAGLSDGIFLAHAHRAVETGDDAALREVAELAAAFVPSRERQLETSAQGRAFIDIARSAWSCAGLEQAVAEPVVPSFIRSPSASSAHRMDSACADAACLPACADLELDFGWWSARPTRADRLPTGSRRPGKVAAATAQRAISAALDDIGSATFRADLASLRHELQYTRLFRS